MGIDLSLLPFENDGDRSVYCYTVLELNRDSEFWLLIRALPSTAGPEELITFFFEEDDPEYESGVGPVQMDQYGEPLSYVCVSDLVSLRSHPAVTLDIQNRAAWAYLAALPGDWLVALYWW
jgi:hypothetical protein